MAGAEEIGFGRGGVKVLTPCSLGAFGPKGAAPKNEWTLLGSRASATTNGRVYYTRTPHDDTTEEEESSENRGLSFAVPLHPTRPARGVPVRP